MAPTNILGYQPPGGYQNWVFTQMLVLVLVLVLVLLPGVGAIKAGRYPCCWYRNSGVNTQMLNVGAYKAAAKLLLSCC